MSRRAPGANGAASAALELWRGAPLADVAGAVCRPRDRQARGALPAGHRARDRRRARERTPRRGGRRLEELIAEEPLRERFHAQRMLALYRAGRQAEALEAYREARKTLIEEIGVEPGRSSSVSRRRSSPRIRPRCPAVDRGAAGAAQGGSPLLAGRERELRWLRKRWEEARGGSICALVSGPAGIGKTRLVAELARRSSSEGRAVLYAAGAGRPRPRWRPSPRPEGPATDAARARLRRRRPARGARGRGRARPRAHGGRDALDLRPASRRAGPARLRRPARARRQSGSARSAGEGGGRRRSPSSTRPPRAAMPLETLIVESEGCRFASTARPASGLGPRRPSASRRPRPTGRRRSGGLRRPGRRSREASSTFRPRGSGRASTRSRSRRIPPESEVCPFRGLAPFDAAHAEYFFGRERLVAELVARLVGSRCSPSSAPPGAASPRRSRRAPAGARRRRRPRLGALAPAVMRPGERPLAELPHPRTGPRRRHRRRGRAPWIARRARAAADASAWCSPWTSSRRPSRPAATRPSARPSSTRWSKACGRPGRARRGGMLAIRADFYGRCPSTPSSRRSSAPTRSWSVRCAATSCGGRSSCRRSERGYGSSPRWSRRWSATSPEEPGAAAALHRPARAVAATRTAAPCATLSYEAAAV